MQLKKRIICQCQCLLFAIVFLVISTGKSSAQYKISQYGHQNGLHLSHIDHIVQDSLGYIWIGARNGLARFDGVKFNHYYHDPNNPESLPFTDISNLACDPKGNLWVGSHEGGIAIYDYKSDVFLRFKLDGESIAKKPMSYLCFDKEGVGFSTFLNNVLYRMEYNGDSLQVDTLQAQNIHYLNIQNWPLKPNHLLLSTTNGLFLYDTKSSKMDTLYPSLQWHHAIFANGTVYGYNYNENVRALNLASNSITYLKDQFKSRLKGITKVDNEIWITNGNDGVIRFSEDNELVDYFKLIPLDNTTENKKENVYVIFQDKEKGIWIGRDRDVLYLSRKKELIKSYTTYTNKYETTYDALPIEAELLLLAPVYENHLLEYNTKTKNSRPIVSKNKYSGPFSIQVFNKDTLIIYNNGIGKYNRKSNSINAYLDSKNSAKINDIRLYNVAKGVDSDIWLLGSNYELIHVYSDGMVEVVTDLKDNLKNQFSRTIMCYDEDILIIGGSSSIVIFSLTKGLLKNILLKDTELKSAINDILLDTTRENKKTLWISSYSNNLFKAELRNNDLIFLNKYSMKEGLLNSRPGELILTKENDLILSSSIGLAKYNDENDRFNRFNDENGFLGSNIVNIKEIDDQIFVFQDEGFSVVDKSAFKINDRPPPIFIEKLTVNSKAVDLHNRTSGPIQFSNNQKNIAIYFSALNYISPQDVLYAYRLSEKEPWSEVNYLEKVARFSQLASGNYEFQIKARTLNSEWSDEKVLRFEILPPIWKRWWFLLLAVLIISTTIYRYIEWREKNINKISDYEKKLIELEGQALRAQMNPHFIFNSLNSIKAFIIRNEPESAADYLTLFADLIRVVLHNSKQKLIPLSAEIEAVDLYTQLENIRLKNKFVLKWCIDNTLDLHAVLIPPLTLQPFVENAIWHGFIHKKTKGKLEIGLFRKKDNLIASIRDDGIGRVKSLAIEGQKTNKKKSYGIAITTQRLDQNQGKERIRIKDLYNENNEAIGTEVELTIDFVHAK
jgi:ligand-binding sensor domain-containing protein